MKYFSLAGYRWLTLLLCPGVLIWDSWRAFRQAIYRPHRAQRWALGLPTPVSAQLIWLHAVSVGETQACAPLLRAVLAAYPQHAVLLTHMTPTGRDTGAALFASDIAQGRVQQCYLPYDIWGLSQSFLRHFKPCTGIVMETEIWPNIVAACHDAQIPIGLANARMSDKTYRRTLRVKRISQQVFSRFTWIAAQSAQDAQRLSLFSQQARQNAGYAEQALVVTGNLKFDVSPDTVQLAHGKQFKTVQNRTVIALASTREGEEALLLAQLKPWLDKQNKTQNKTEKNNPLILLIPRHPKRAAALAALLQTQGFSFCQRSTGQAPQADTQVYLCDTLGEMWFYYGASDVAVVGGAWLPHGGQNLIEPCMAGCAVVVGPHMFNFTYATELAVASGAAVQCASLDDLSIALDALADATHRQTMATRGLSFASAHAGATQAHLVLLKKSMGSLALATNTASHI